MYGAKWLSLINSMAYWSTVRPPWFKLMNGRSISALAVIGKNFTKKLLLNVFQLMGGVSLSISAVHQIWAISVSWMLITSTSSSSGIFVTFSSCSVLISQCSASSHVSFSEKLLGCNLRTSEMFPAIVGALSELNLIRAYSAIPWVLITLPWSRPFRSSCNSSMRFRVSRISVFF